jgi:biotin operon repressor
MSPQTSSEERRSRLVEMLRSAAAPVTGSALSKRLGVSRQVIVNDVAIVRASGEPVLGSPRGYVLTEVTDDRPIATVACRHDPDGWRRELEILVDRGIAFLLQTPKPVPEEPPAPASSDRVVPFLGLAVIHRLRALGTASSIWSTNDSHQKRTVRREADSWDP